MIGLFKQEYLFSKAKAFGTGQNNPDSYREYYQLEQPQLRRFKVIMHFHIILIRRRIF